MQGFYDLFSANYQLLVQKFEKLRFTNAIIYTKPSFERFLNILDDGRVQYDIRIGSYQSGDKYGMPHDHGSGFRVREDYILYLYESMEFVNLE